MSTQDGKTKRGDEEVVMFCNSKTFSEFPEGQIPKETVVLTELLDYGKAVIVPKDKFLEWLYDGGQLMS